MPSEITQFVSHHAERITPSVIANLRKKLPLLKAEFTQIEAPRLPHLIDQLEFLVDAVEDAADGAYNDLPYTALADAAFAVLYAHQAIDILPDHLPGMGRQDDSAIVRYVLMRHERAFGAYADKRGIDWSKITTEP
jgi:uncharacterized membrane protein YkvA (DUF1232 family)